MAEKYFVVSDRECPGSEHDSYEEAQKVLRELQSKGLREARILCPPCYKYWGEEETKEHEYLSYSFSYDSPLDYDDPNMERYG